jgi:hypothetical protein
MAGWRLRFANGYKTWLPSGPNLEPWSHGSSPSTQHMGTVTCQQINKRGTAQGRVSGAHVGMVMVMQRGLWETRARGMPYMTMHTTAQVRPACTSSLGQMQAGWPLTPSVQTGGAQCA